MNLFLLTTIFALVCLDRKNAFQISLSQPLFTCTMIGFLLGFPLQAMFFGMIVQLVWLSNLPIGAAKTPEGDIGSIIGCILYVKFYDSFSAFGNFLLFFTFLYTVVCSYVASILESLTRKTNIWFLNYALDSIKIKNKNRVGYATTGAILFQFVLNFVFIGISVLLGSKLLMYFEVVIESISIDVWQFVEVAILGSGIGMLMSVFRDKKSKRIITGLSLTFLIILLII